MDTRRGLSWSSPRRDDDARHPHTQIIISTKLVWCDMTNTDKVKAAKSGKTTFLEKRRAINNAQQKAFDRERKLTAAHNRAATAEDSMCAPALTPAFLLHL